MKRNELALLRFTQLLVMPRHLLNFFRKKWRNSRKMKIRENRASETASRSYLQFAQEHNHIDLHRGREEMAQVVSTSDLKGIPKGAAAGGGGPKKQTPQKHEIDKLVHTVQELLPSDTPWDADAITRVLEKYSYDQDKATDYILEGM